jgi:cytochrome d ubiquinol oxidase subunit I
VQLDSFWGLLTNPWVRWQYLHNMSGAAITGAFVLAAMGAFFLLSGRHLGVGRVCVRVGVVGALIFTTLQIFPTGDRAAHDVAVHQPATFAAMEGAFRTEKGAPLVILGNPDMERHKLDSSVGMPHFLSFLTSRRWNSTITGLNEIPERDWPDSVPLVYYAYHIMVGLGTILLVIALIACLLLWRGRLYTSRTMLWTLMLAFPFTYIANIAGWATTEVGRQPWIVYGLLRTSDGASPAGSVPAGSAIFTLLGFAGLYLLVGILYLVLILRIVNQGPDDETQPVTSAAAAAGAAG